MILWAFEYIAHVGLFFPLQKMLVLKSRKYQISDSDYTLLKQLCFLSRLLPELVRRPRRGSFFDVPGKSSRAAVSKLCLRLAI